MKLHRIRSPRRCGENLLPLLHVSGAHWGSPPQVQGKPIGYLRLLAAGGSLAGAGKPTDKALDVLSRGSPRCGEKLKDVIIEPVEIRSPAGAGKTTGKGEVKQMKFRITPQVRGKQCKMKKENLTLRITAGGENYLIQRLCFGLWDHRRCGKTAMKYSYSCIAQDHPQVRGKLEITKG